MLDELRARVDYQSLQQSLITSMNQFEKDKIALARVIGLPLDQNSSSLTNLLTPRSTPWT